MWLRRFAACVVTWAVLAGGAAATGGVEPRFTLGATAAVPGAELALRVERAPIPAQRELALYLVGRGVQVRSRLDERLSFIGYVRGVRRARLRFTVPPLAPGEYALAYSSGRRFGIQSTLRIRVDAPRTDGCHVTKPNGRAPGGRTSPTFHGNGALWSQLRADGTVQANDLGGAKLIWAARAGVSRSARFTVDYQLLEHPFTQLSAQVVPGTLSGYSGPSWASRMSFQPGCWKITGRLNDTSLSYVVRVELPPRSIGPSAYHSLNDPG